MQQFGGFDSVWMPMVATSQHLQWIQNSRTSLISILFLYKYSSYDYRVIFFMSKCVYIILGHPVYHIYFKSIYICCFRYNGNIITTFNQSVFLLRYSMCCQFRGRTLSYSKHSGVSTTVCITLSCRSELSKRGCFRTQFWLSKNNHGFSQSCSHTYFRMI